MGLGSVGGYGAAHSGPPVLPIAVRQVKSNTAPGGAITLDNLPLKGSILVAMAFANQITASGTCSGGGVTTWNLICQRVAGSSGACAMNMWCGVVDGTPSTTVTATTAGVNYRSRCVEFAYSGLKTGVIRVAADATGQGNEGDTAAGVVVTDPLDGGLAVFGYASSTGVGTLPDGVTLAIGGTLSSRDGYIWYLPTQYQKDTKLGFSMFASGGHVIVTAAIIT